MNTNEINANRKILEFLLDRAVLDVMTWTHKNCVSIPQEPDYIAALATRFTRNLYYILQSVFPGNIFSVSGVFCHQKPIVDIGCGKKPELGDLLLVYIDNDCSGEKMYNALLSQAKISNNSKMKANEFHQLELYKKWPEFEYYRAGHSLNGKKRNICPKTINDGAQYLLIDDNPYTNGLDGDVDKFPMGCAIPDRILKIDDKFTREVINFLKFKSGRTFESHRAITEDWSQMVWDLLCIAGLSCSRRKNIGLDKFPRNNTYVHLCSEEMKGKTLFAKLSGAREALQYDDEGVGVSVILIENNSFTGDFRRE